MKNIILAGGILFNSFLFLSGCGPSYLVVGTRPEPPRYVRPIAPGPGYVWIEGEWITGPHGYVYRQGYWTVPKGRYHRYIPGHWQQRRQGWYWSHGYWR